DHAGGKEFRPLTYCRHPGGVFRDWRWTTWRKPRPLFNADKLQTRRAAPVLIVEGEKSCHAAERLAPGLVGITSPVIPPPSDTHAPLGLMHPWMRFALCPRFSPMEKDSAMDTSTSLLVAMVTLLTGTSAALSQPLTEGQARAIIAPWYSLFNV